MSFPLSFPLARTAETLLRVLDRKEVPYALDSRFRFRWAQGEIAVPVHFAGELPVPAIPKIAVRDFSISALGLDGLRARVIASVTNPNSFSIPIDRLRFHARLNGNTVLQNELFRAVELAPQKSRDLPLDLRVGLAELGLTAASLARRPRLDWELSGDVQAGLFAMPLRLQGQVRAP